MSALPIALVWGCWVAGAFTELSLSLALSGRILWKSMVPPDGASIWPWVWHPLDHSSATILPPHDGLFPLATRMLAKEPRIRPLRPNGRT